eukprot:TRINITY_DN20151_c0_g1_i1.p1 TRINITY_DN20151_c0_g1~~TRINITY_DN20151_c0_g1_i1.p1  ORF type:complete len:239 (+),score=35.98 TRINITY_DN20151_c0_g1_i1:39-755(+)
MVVVPAVVVSSLQHAAMISHGNGRAKGEDAIMVKGPQAAHCAERRPRSPRLRCSFSFRPSDPRQLLDHAIDIVVRNGWPSISWRHNFTALHLAAVQGCCRTVRLLRGLGATDSLSLRDESNMRPIDYALARGEVDLKLLGLLDPSRVKLISKPRVQLQTNAPVAEAADEKEVAKYAFGAPLPDAPLPTLLSPRKSSLRKHDNVDHDDGGDQVRHHASADGKAVSTPPRQAMVLGKVCP